MILEANTLCGILHHYFNRRVCLSIRASHTGFFASKIISNQGNNLGMELRNHLFLIKKLYYFTFFNPKTNKRDPINYFEKSEKNF